MRLYIALIVFIPFLVSAQKTKKVVIEDYDLFARHEYYVLKKDKSIKHGVFKSTWVNGNPRLEGYYKNGKKDSLWTYFHQYKPIVCSRGYYEEDKKIGVWEYFDSKGKIMNRYDHSTHQLSYTTFVDTVKTYELRINDSTFEAKPQQPPIFLEGETVKNRVIQENISYPQEAITNNIFGTVHVSFFVNNEGQATDHQIIKSIGGGCDEEALRVVMLIPDEWAPAIYNGTVVESKVIVLITFVLN
ncbi:TonB family protein [Paracrocinitomix mangrovi]|uniref:energy transducer TonB n=1 Tax=Paracrocinitomix mangrovi TaxID=2862509 RepID=UPI001C8DF2DC|nr:energy transducer TonB [Paracrocinitomix mangrovi]UKN00169.1 TonB family protein [Paracrocinitomix mangrovi]